MRVPFRDRRALATVVALLEETKAKGIREIEAVIGEGPTLSEPLLELARWIANYYCCPIEAVMRSLLPQVIRRAEVGWKKQQFIEIGSTVTSGDDGGVAASRAAPGGIARGTEQSERANSGRGNFAPIIAQCFNSARTGEARPGENNGARRRARPARWRTIHSRSGIVTERRTNRGLRHDRASHCHRRKNAKPILLHGVTGSGKTEIYLQAIRETLKRNRTAIVLVPEISLTPQTVERFKSRFAESQDDVAVLHSHLSEGERHDEWHKVHSGRARIVIGARSAVFAPLKNLGLIVVDEEHETSYKQEEAPRYHARDVAVVRAKIEKAVVLLGSATPSLESYHNTLTKKYRARSI